MRPSPARRFHGILCALLLLGIAAPLAAQLRPLGLEQRIDGNIGAGRTSVCPATTVLADGSFLVVWSLPQEAALFHCDPSGTIFARRLAVGADGDIASQGRRMVLLRTGSVCIEDLQVGRPQDGRLAVTWATAAGDSGGVTGLGGRTLDEEGRPSGHFRPAGDRVLALRSGDLLVLFRTGDRQRPGLAAQRLDAAGRPRGPRFPVAHGGDRGDRGELSVNTNLVQAAELADGNLAIVWQPFAADGFGRGVRGRLFAANGRPLGAGFVVTDDPDSGQPLVASNPDGRFAVVWSAGKFQADVFARLYSAEGVPATGPVAVNTSPDGEQRGLAVDLDAQGQTVVVWQSRRGPGGEDVVARLLAEDGSLLGKALSVQSQKAGEQSCGRLVGDGNGRWLAVWSGDGPQGKGVYARVLVEE